MDKENKFTDVRIALELSQEDIAKILVIGRTTVSNYENGFNVPMRTRRILLSKFGVNLNWWEDDNEPMFVNKSDEIGKNQPQQVPMIQQNGSTVDTLIAMLSAKDKQIEAKDTQIAYLINQLSAKDKQINKLQSIIETNLNLPATDVAMAG